MQRFDSYLPTDYTMSLNITTSHTPGTCLEDPLSIIFSRLLKHALHELHELPGIGSGKLVQSFSESTQHPLWHISVLIHHTNSAASVPIPYSQAPTTKPWESRWPNKPRPHLMRSDSLHCRGRGLGFPLSVPLGISSVQQVTQPSGCPMAAGWQLKDCWN